MTNDNYNYEGERKDGIPHGQGTMFFNNGGRYVGCWKEGTFHGQGTLITSDGTFLAGSWENGKMTSGAMLMEEKMYVGGFKDLIFQGRGILSFSGNFELCGEFKDGMLNGSGIMNTSAGMIEGIFENGNLKGSVSIFNKEGKILTGEWGNKEKIEKLNRII